MRYLPGHLDPHKKSQKIEQAKLHQEMDPPPARAGESEGVV